MRLSPSTRMISGNSLAALAAHDSSGFVNPSEGQKSLLSEGHPCLCYKTVAAFLNNDFVFFAIVLIGAAGLAAYAKWDFRRKIRRNTIS
jgi:hypothetical protein